MKITRYARTKIKTILEENGEYNPYTVTVNRFGEIFAKKNQNNDNCRYFVGYTSQFLKENGDYREEYLLGR